MEKVAVLPVPSEDGIMRALRGGGATGDRGRGGHTGLGLGDGISALQDGQNTLLLNGGRFLKTVSVNATEKILLEVEVVEVVDALVPVGFNFNI